jgi:hypothetical protein
MVSEFSYSIVSDRFQKTNCFFDQEMEETLEVSSKFCWEMSLAISAQFLNLRSFFNGGSLLLERSRFFMAESKSN